MIVVLADDLTGAAELGGIGLRFNLDVEIDMAINPQSKAGLLIISTDTRSMKKKQAALEAGKATSKVMQLKPDIIFKKVDSVLRGHVMPEMAAQLKELHLTKAILVPANPALGRTMVDGIYYINGIPIHETSFSNDPEFAIKSSRVLDMLGHENGQITVIKNGDPLPETGVIVGEAKTVNDLDAWAGRVDKNMLIAGASGFFKAVLNTINVKDKTNREQDTSAFGKPALFVCGSAFGKSVESIRKIRKKGGPVSYMPEEIVSSQHPAECHYDEWSDELVSMLASHGRAIMAINEEDTRGHKISTGDLRQKTAMAVEAVLDKIYIRELLVEGGSTASTIIKRLGFNRFFPIQELMPGVIRMSVEGKDDFYLTLKPGSYDWPADIWKF